MDFIRSLPLRMRVCVCVVHGRWPEGTSPCFPMKSHLLLAVHLEKRSVNRPLTQKTSSLRITRDAPVRLSAAHCATTRTNCPHRPLHKNLVGPRGSHVEAGSMVVQEGEVIRCVPAEPEVNRRSTSLLF